MANFEETLYVAIKRVKGFYIEDSSSKHSFNLIYPFTTENINGYINKFSLKDKSLMTIGSSGDQALNAILKGCKDITVVDINPYTKFYYYLKMSGVISLDYNEFPDFFCYYRYKDAFHINKGVFNQEMFSKMKDTLIELDYESYHFFNELLNNFSYKDIREYLFSGDESGYKHLKFMNPYIFNEENYNKLRTKIENISIEFIISDIEEVKLNKTFDNIWLSNLGKQYENLEEFKNLINKISLYLNRDGKMLITYLYRTDEPFEKGFRPIYNLEVLLELFKEYNSKLINIVGTGGILFENKQMKDSVLVYKKN